MLKIKDAKFRKSLKTSAIIVIVLWVIHLIQVALEQKWVFLGVLPRKAQGLHGIFTSPFIHSDYAHLISNSLPVFVVVLMLTYFYKKIALQSILVIYVLTGIAVWAFARQVFHIGASGVLYGLVAFVFWIGIFRRNIRSIALALVVAFWYGGMMYGVLPVKEGVSWESHLFGALVGIFTAFLFKNQLEPEEIPVPPDYEDHESTYFLDRDTFEKTRKQRETEEGSEGWWTSDNTWENLQ